MNILASCVTLHALLLLALSPLGQGEKEISQRKCLDTARHKLSPSEEKDLHPVCSYLKGEVCCTKETTDKIGSDLTNFYKLNQHVCKNLSKSCMEFFQKDACLFECSPDFWEYENNKMDGSGLERVKLVPLCESECNAWFNACAKDLTCSTNWSSPAHKGKKGSSAPDCTDCVTFQKKFGTPDNFCQSVWDNSYHVVKDDEKCMRFRGKSQSGQETPKRFQYDSPSVDANDRPVPATTERVHSDSADNGRKNGDTKKDSGKNSSDSVFINATNLPILATLYAIFYIIFNKFQCNS